MARRLALVGVGVGVGVGLVCLASPAAAQQPTKAQTDAVRQNCRSDFMSKCSGVTPGGAEAMQCLKKNVASLSSGCQGAVNAINGEAPAAAPAASAPAMPPAASAPPPPRHADRRRPRDCCLNAHGPALSPACQAAMKVVGRR